MMLSVENPRLARHPNGLIILCGLKLIDVVSITPTATVTQNGATSMKLKGRSNGKEIQMKDGKIGLSLGLGQW